MTTSAKAMPVHGVRNRGCVHANTRGSPPSRPIANSVRDVRCRPPSAAMKPEAATEKSMITASQLPTYRVASVSSAAGSFAQSAALLTP